LYNILSYIAESKLTNRLR